MTRALTHERENRMKFRITTIVLMVYLALGFRVMNLQAQSHWQHADLTAITEGPGTLNPIAMAFDPVWQGTRTHYVDDYRHVHELFLSGTHWQDADLTAIAKGADLDGELAMAFDPVWQVMRTHYIGSDWHVHELFVSGETGLDHGIGHIRLVEVDSEEREVAPPIPKSPQTSNAASDRKSAPPPLSRRAG